VKIYPLRQAAYAALKLLGETPAQRKASTMTRSCGSSQWDSSTALIFRTGTGSASIDSSRGILRITAAIAIAFGSFCCGNPSYAQGAVACPEGLLDEAREKADEEFRAAFWEAREQFPKELKKQRIRAPWEATFTDAAPFRATGWIIGQGKYVSTRRLDMGRVEVKGDRISLISSDPLGRSGTTPRHYALVRWHGSVFLVEPEQLLAFCNDVNGGRCQRGSHSYLRRVEDLWKELAGLPQVPTEYRKYLLKQPVRATITKIGSAEVTATVAGRNDPARGVPLTVNVGTADGIHAGMLFYHEYSERHVVVVAARDKTATLLVEGFAATERAAKDRELFIPGSQLSTVDALYAEDEAAPVGRKRPAGGMKGPSFRGKKVEDYIADLKSKDDDARVAAFDCLPYFSPLDQQALPVLLEIARDKTDVFRSRAVYELGRLGKKPEQVLPVLLERLQDHEPFVRRSAALGLGVYGREAGRALPDLLVMVDKDEGMVRSAAAFALGAIGSAPARVVPALSKALRATDKSDREEIRDRAAQALGKLGHAGETALLEALGDNDREVRLVAAKALWKSAHRPEAIAAIANLLQESDEKVREQAAHAVHEIGADARTALATLIAALKDHEDVRTWVADALAKIGKPAVRPLLRLLRDKDARVRERAAYALGVEPLQPQVVVPALIRILEDPDERVRAQAAASLGIFKGAAAVAVPALVLAMKDQFIRSEVIQTLRSLGPDAAPAVAVLLEAMQDGGHHYDAVDTLGAIGPAAGTALPHLIHLLKGDDVVLAEGAAAALAKIGPPETVVPILIRALARKRIAGAAAAALGSMGRRAKVAVPDLVPLLANEEPGLRHAAVGALGDIGPDARAALPLIISKLKDAEPRIRGRAAESLGKIGSPAPEVLQALVAAMGDANLEVRMKAALAHWRLRRQPEAVVPALTEYLAYVNPRWCTFLPAVECLNEIGPAAADAVPTLRRVQQFSFPYYADRVGQALTRIEQGKSAKTVR
jgi:HEAT repeat protein